MYFLKAQKGSNLESNIFAAQNFLKDYFLQLLSEWRVFTVLGEKEKLRISKKRSNIKISPKLNKLTRKSVQSKKIWSGYGPLICFDYKKLPGCSSKLFQIAFLLWPDGLLEAVCWYVVMLGRMGCFQVASFAFYSRKSCSKFSLDYGQHDNDHFVVAWPLLCHQLKSLLGKHSTMVSLLASRPSYSGFNSQHSQFFFRGKSSMLMMVMNGIANWWKWTVALKSWSNPSCTG